MKITNTLLSILILLNIIILFRLFTLNTSKITITKTIENIKEDNRKFELNLKEIEQLEQITLKKNASTEDVRTYIRSIYEISKNKKGWSDNIPEIEKFNALESKHIPVMLEFMKIQDSDRLIYALSETIKNKIEEKQRYLLIDALSTNKELVQILIDKNWVKDAKEILFTSIKHQEKYYPTEWIHAVSLIADSSIYPDLKNYLVNGFNPFSTFQYVHDLPGINLENEVEYLWKNRDQRISLTGYEEIEIAKIAVIYGHYDALQLLIRKLNVPEEERWGVEEILRNHLSIPQDENNIKKWYKENINKISYNKIKKIWEIK